MTKAAHHDPSSVSESTLGQFTPDAILDAYTRWVRQMEDIHRALLGSAQQSQDSGWELTKRLSACTDPGEAVRLCTEWMNGRRDAALDDGRRLSELMLRLWNIDVGGGAAEQPATAARANLATVQRSMAAGE